MHTHGIEILNRADDDDVVSSVAHHLQLEFFPSQDRLFDESFVHRREVEAAGQHFAQLFAVVRDASAGAAEREGRTNDDRKSDLPGKLDPVFRVVDQRRLGNIEADALHRIFEKQPVFRLLDRGNVRADQMHIVLFQHPAIRKFNGQVQRSLPANGRQHGKARAGRHLALNTDDLFEILQRERLDVSAVGRLRIGHDGRRIRVGQHHFKALSLERLAGLRARVVELRRLPDDDGPGAEDEDLFDVSTFWHLLSRESFFVPISQTSTHWRIN